MYIHGRDILYLRDFFDRAWLLAGLVKTCCEGGDSAVAEEEVDELSSGESTLHSDVKVSQFSSRGEPGIRVTANADSSDVSEYSAGAATYGALIINADDWGRDKETTDKTEDCLRLGTVSAASGMVFMEDSERAANIGRENGFDVGLHLNFTLSFSDPRAPRKLREHQTAIKRFLTRHKYSQILFHPFLRKSFEYVVLCQLDEHRRLYGCEPDRIDGHHHKHLCTNVLASKLLPARTRVRRNFTFGPDEKSFGNRYYRKMVDEAVAKRHRCTDYFFSLAPLDPIERIKKAFALARQHEVEIETHPINPIEYEFLTSDAVLACAGDIPIASRFRI